MEENKLRVTIGRLLENSIYIGNLCVLTKNDNSKMDLPLPPFTLTVLIERILKL